MKDKIIKLKNGGVLIYSKTKLNNCFALEVGFRVGAIADKKPGTAHFLEHTLFKKTKNRSNADVEADRNRIAFVNASTSMDYLLLNLYRTNKLAEKSFEFAEDILMNSVIDDEYLESEKGVIIEELNMCLDRQSRDVYSKNIMQAISKAKNVSDIVGKTEKNISNIKFRDLVEFKNTHFVGNNFVASIATSLPLRKVKKLVDKYFVTKIPYNKDYKKVDGYYEIAKIDKDSSVKIYKNSQDKVSVLISFKIDVDEIDIYTKNYNYSFITKYLSGSQGELFLKLRNKGLVYRIDSDISSFKGESLFNIVFESSKEKIKSILDIISDEINKLVTTKLDSKITEDYKNNLEYFADEKMSIKPTAKCHLNIMDYLSFGKLIEISNKQKKSLRNEVNPENVYDVSNQIFNKNTKIYVTVKGDVTKSYIPDLKYFEDKFLISEKSL